MSWRSLSVTALLMASAVVSAHTACADEWFSFVRLTCLPEQDYAEVETLGIYNVVDSYRNLPPSLASAGLHELQEVADKPLTCELPLGRVAARLTYYHAPEARGLCGGVEDADMEVTVDRTVVADAKSTHGGCYVMRRHLIWIQPGEAHHCLMPYDDLSGQPLSPGTCQTVRLPLR